MHTHNKILGVDGLPIDKSDANVHDSHMPPGVEALIETRLNGAIDRMRDLNHSEMQRYAQNYSKNWKTVALASWFITILFLFITPYQIPAWIKQFVQENMTKPNMEKIADEAIRSKMGAYVDGKLRKVENVVYVATENIASLTNQIVTVSKDITNAKEDLSEINHDMTILQNFFSAKRGDRKGYNELMAASQKTNSFLASTLFTEVVESYRDFKRDMWNRSANAKIRRIMHAQTQQYFLSTAESLYFGISKHPDPNQRQASITDIEERKLLYFVENLKNVATQDDNVYVALCAVISLERMLGKSFGDLPPFQEVIDWWNTEGKTNVVYFSPFADIEKALKMSSQNKIESIKLYESCVSNRTGLSFSLYQLGALYVTIGDRSKAKESLRRATVESQGQTDAIILYALLLIAEGDQKLAIQKLKEAEPYMKNFHDTIRTDSRFASLRTNALFRTLVRLDNQSVK